ncbi:MAG: signal peptide peptidase SppA [Mycobacteriales bacterium]
MSGVIDTVREARQRRTAPLVLELDLSHGLVDEPGDDPLSMLRAYRRTRLTDVLDGLRRAAADRRVVALVAKIAPARLGLAKVQELRKAVLALREAGTPTVAWAETYGEFGPGTVPYYLASAFETVWVQPTGDLGLTGVALEQRFLRDALDKIGVSPQVSARQEYKNAPDMFTQRGFTGPHREAMARMIDSVTEQLVAGIAEARNLEPAAVRALVDRAPLTAAEAVEAGLVDRVGYRDEVYAAVRGQAGPEARLLYLGRYRKAAAEQLASRVKGRRQQVVALVNASGAIMLGRSNRGPGPGGRAVGSDTVTAAFRAAVRDEHVRAILFRVDSPGGSYIASDAIWREVGLAREAGKPVVVSMGNMAASGGYYVSMAADAIVAQPGTLTGSIGVFAGKAVTRELEGKLGVARDAVTAGEHALMFSTGQPFSDEEWERLNAWLDRVYEDFVGKAAAGRGMDRDRLEALARGRVWTGADAAERGLVDELGGLRDALALARKRAGLPDDAPLRRFPAASPLSRLRPPESSEDPAAASARLSGWGSYAALAGRLGLPAAGPLYYPYGGIA